LFPVYLAREDRDARAFVRTFQELRDLVFAESILEERLRRHIKVETTGLLTWSLCPVGNSVL
jgi:hypothetical protein